MTILVTGGTGMVGCALKNLIPNAKFVGSEFDLRDYRSTDVLFSLHEPYYVIHLAARVGGVKANSDNPASFYYDNIMMNTNVLEAARKYKAKKVVSFLSTCIFPDKVSYPITEKQIHNGPPHPSNYAYAYAKRMLDIQSQAYRDQYGCNFVTAVPNNLFGEHDNFDLDNSHLIPAIIRKIYEAKNKNKDVTLWGDGKALREFTYSTDLAKIVLLLLNKYDGREPINVGNTIEYSIKEVAEKISKIMNFNGKIIWDTSQPNGQYKKPSNNSNLIKLGWKIEDYTSFDVALEKTCHWFVDNYPNVRGVK